MIFTLLFGDGAYHLSRNFSLQQVGDINWITTHYCFEIMSRYLDELMVLDVSRGDRDPKGLVEQIRALCRNVFAPVAAGGGIRSLEDANRLFRAGVDKVVLNSAFFLDPALPRHLAAVYGSQSIVASLDYRVEAGGARRVRIRNGGEETGVDLVEAVHRIEELGAGEVFMTCIDRDGTGQGYDIEGLRLCAAATGLPLIASGGAGNSAHFARAFSEAGVQAVATANLFNFMDEGLQDARAELLDMDYPLGNWASHEAAP